MCRIPRTSCPCSICNRIKRTVFSFSVNIGSGQCFVPLFHIETIAQIAIIPSFIALIRYSNCNYLREDSFLNSVDNLNVINGVKISNCTAL